MAGLGLGLGLGLARSTGGGAAPLPAPTTVNYTHAETVSGWGGTLSTTKNAARLYGTAPSTSTASIGGGTFWVGYITGTDAYIFANSDFGANAGLISVSLDNGASFTAAPNTTTKYTLFAGLSHARRFVIIRFGGSFGTAPYVQNTGTRLEVTGQPPSIQPVVGWRLPEDGNTDTISAVATIAGVVNYTPILMPNATGGSTFGSNCPSIRISTNSTELVILTHSAAVYVSVDGAAPTKYTQTAGIAVVITGLSGTHTYNIWCSDVFRLYVGILSGSFSNVTDKKRLDQFGDSITQGGSGGFSTQGDVETFAAASALGYVGGTYGVGGNTIAALNTRLDTVLAAKTVTGSDVAIIAVGRNDGATASGTRQSGYVSIINKLIAKGYGKILCRSVLRDGDGDSYPLINADIAAAVTTVADAKAVYVDIEGWSPVATHDDVHPIEAGYITMRGYAIADYPAYLP